ncbi:hypothetical protein [Streptomyces sp. NPDC049879]|uniref:hypothetical protein n=1 Tax=Streptomyces sp. NPDC049879 TaxID=3365598 RepID=UPI00379AB5DE
MNSTTNGSGGTAALVAARPSTAAVAPRAVALASVFLLLSLVDRVVAVVVAAMTSAWCAGRFRSRYRQLIRSGRERAARDERGQRPTADPARPGERGCIARTAMA